jgi:hypothetical protein
LNVWVSSLPFSLAFELEHTMANSLAVYDDPVSRPASNVRPIAQQRSAKPTVNAASNASMQTHAWLSAMPEATPPLPVQVLLDMFEQPIHFHPFCVRLTGSAMAALWLSWALRKTQAVMGGEPMTSDDLFSSAEMGYHVAASPGEAWFEAKVEDISTAMGMSKFEQQNAKRVLQTLGLLDVRKEGLPAKTLYRVNLPLMMEMITQRIDRSTNGI